MKFVKDFWFQLDFEVASGRNGLGELHVDPVEVDERVHDEDVVVSSTGGDLLQLGEHGALADAEHDDLGDLFEVIGLLHEAVLGFACARKEGVAL